MRMREGERDGVPAGPKSKFFLLELPTLSKGAPPDRGEVFTRAEGVMEAGGSGRMGTKEDEKIYRNSSQDSNDRRFRETKGKEVMEDMENIRC